MRGSTGSSFICVRGICASDASLPKMGVRYFVSSSIASRTALVDVRSFIGNLL